MNGRNMEPEMEWMEPSAMNYYVYLFDQICILDDLLDRKRCHTPPRPQDDRFLEAPSYLRKELFFFYIKIITHWQLC